jgi:hypothetical protein
MAHFCIAEHQLKTTAQKAFGEHMKFPLKFYKEKQSLKVEKADPTKNKNVIFDLNKSNGRNDELFIDSTYTSG